MDVELKTEFRLNHEIELRAWRESDLEVVFAAVSKNSEHLQTFMRWMKPDYSIDDARTFLTEADIARKERTNLGLGIFRREELIGSIGLSRFDWTAQRAEIGYWIDKDFEGKGIVTLASQRLIDYAFNELKLNRVEIRCSAENRRSAIIPLKLGFQKEGTFRQSEFLHGRFHDFYTFGLLADDPRLW